VCVCVRVWNAREVRYPFCVRQYQPDDTTITDRTLDLGWEFVTRCVCVLWYDKVIITLIKYDAPYRLRLEGCHQRYSIVVL
jgi:hypothetical protein